MLTAANLFGPILFGATGWIFVVLNFLLRVVRLFPLRARSSRSHDGDDLRDVEEYEDCEHDEHASQD